GQQGSGQEKGRNKPGTPVHKSPHGFMSRRTAGAVRVVLRRLAAVGTPPATFAFGMSSPAGLRNPHAPSFLPSARDRRRIPWRAVFSVDAPPTPARRFGLGHSIERGQT